MTKHLINTLRKTVAGVFLMVLPVRSHKLKKPKPIKQPLNPETDMWLFEPTRSVDAHAGDYFGQMDKLSESLGSLRTLLSDAPATRPTIEYRVDVTPMTAIWSDALLFDGEPHVLASEVQSDLDVHTSFLFETPVPVVTYGQIVAADQMSIQPGGRLRTKLAA